MKLWIRFSWLLHRFESFGGFYPFQNCVLFPLRFNFWKIARKLQDLESTEFANATMHPTRNAEAPPHQCEYAMKLVLFGSRILPQLQVSYCCLYLILQRQRIHESRAPGAQERWRGNSARIKLVSLFQVQLCWYRIDVKIRCRMDAKHFAVFWCLCFTLSEGMVNNLSS